MKMARFYLQLFNETGLQNQSLAVTYPNIFLQVMGQTLGISLTAKVLLRLMHLVLELMVS